jgi:hypothetical protein
LCSVDGWRSMGRRLAHWEEKSWAGTGKIMGWYK